MIPKVIHYCWYGKNEMSPLNEACIRSWKKKLPDYEIKKWSEENTPIKSFRYMEKAYDKKMWAFVADYMRMYVLYKYGGIYLDTDMEVIKSFDPLLRLNSFVGLESEGQVSAGIIACEPGNIFIRFCLEYMDKEAQNRSLTYTSIPRIMQMVRDGGINEIEVLPVEYFYPYNPWDKQKNIKQLMYSNISENTYAIHHWAASWLKPKSFSVYFRSILRYAINNFPRSSG